MLAVIAALNSKFDTVYHARNECVYTEIVRCLSGNFVHRSHCD